MTLGLHKDKVELMPYTTEWADEFKKEKAILEKLLHGYALAIEHVGSTSIPGLSAKPILDIAVAVKDVNTLKNLIPLLSENGYDPLNSIEAKEELLARKGTPENRTHYIHIEIIGNTYWTNHILFRDYLLKHPEVIKEYEYLKQKLSTEHKDEREKYTAAKNEFIQHVLKLAELEKTETER